MRSEALSFLGEQFRIARLEDLIAPVPLHPAEKIRHLAWRLGGDRHQFGYHFIALDDFNLFAFGKPGFDLFEGVAQIANRGPLHM